MSYKSGFAAVIGRPNTGKSTLVNRLVGDKVSIISPKPQTTRTNIRGIATGKEWQVIYLDTPGIHNPKTKLGEIMVDMAVKSISEVDLVILVVDATEENPGNYGISIVEMIKKSGTKTFLVINKIDIVEKERLLPVIGNYSSLMEFEAIIPVSALKNDGIDILSEAIISIMPKGPVYFPEDEITDQPERNIAAEIIREKILLFTDDEVPHGTGVVIESYKPRTDTKLTDIEAIVICEKDSHKGILIGKKGDMLKKIGTEARLELEALFGIRINLKLWVKVQPDWRNKASMLKTLGYRE